MSMNSFSFKADKRNRKSREETVEAEISQLLNLHPEGEAFPLDPLQKMSRQDFKPLQLSLAKDEWQDPMGRRKSPRYALNLTVLISNHRRAFRSQTLNMSSGGLLLKDLLPEEFSQHSFDILLIHATEEGEKTFLLFRGKALSGRLRSRQVQFESLSQGCESKLMELFEGLSPAP